MDEESLAKRQRVEGLTEEVRETPEWERLPCHLIVQVLSYLTDPDRLAMAQVCKAWYTSFQDPSLWRYREFVLGGHNATQTAERIKSFASMFASCLQNVVIFFDHTTPDACQHITETMAYLMKKLEKARLSRIMFWDIESDKFNKFEDRKDIVVGSLVKMLRSQTTLKRVELYNCQFSHSSGTEVVRTLQECSGQTLESIDLDNFFVSVVHDPETGPLKLDLSPVDVEKFTNLRKIRIHYSYISNEVLELWSVNLKEKLEHITLQVLDNEHRSQVISSTTWSNLAKACPKLKVNIIVDEFHYAIKFIRLLVPGIPLALLIMRSTSKGERDELDILLKYLAANFHERLEHLTLWFPYLEEEIEYTIKGFIEKCRKLSSMNVGVPDSVAVKVAILLVNHLSELNLKSVHMDKRDEQDTQDWPPHQYIMMTFHDRLKNSSNLAVDRSGEE